ncbi:MAG TPA: hypothetical protein VLH86_03495 [Patescibacteria group bacterium]|nr:hypothetical protein [Patescibacteria group bacterium]
MTEQEQPAAKKQLTPQEIEALLRMAEMQSMGGKAMRKPPYVPLLIVTGVTVLVMVVAYVAVLWMAHHR